MKLKWEGYKMKPYDKSIDGENLYKLSEKQYIKTPDKWDVQFVGFSINGKPYAIAKKK